MKRVYIASPYSHKEKSTENMRFEIATRWIASLQYHNKDIAFIAPITQSHTFKQFEPRLGGSFEEWREIDLCFIDGCHEVWVLGMDGVHESIGVKEEIAHAKKHGIPVYFLTDVKGLDLKIQDDRGIL